MKDIKFKYGMNSLISVFLLLGIIIFVNIISIHIFKRFDLTDGKVFTLAKASKNVVKNLDDKVVVKAYFSKGLPHPYSSNARYLKDQLDEYRAYSKGHLEYEFIDPVGDENKEREAQMYGIPPVQVNAIENDKVEMKKVYMGLVFLYEDKKETIPVVQNTVGLEYDITSIIGRITSKEIKTVGFLTGHDEVDLYKDINTVRTVLEKQYNVLPVSVADGREVSPDISALIIAGPQKSLTDWEKFAIDQFIMKGGEVIFLIDKVKTDFQSSKSEKLNLNIDQWTQNYGFKINDDLVIDYQNRRITVTQQQGYFSISNVVPYPFLVMATNLNKSNVIVKDLEAIDFPFISSIDTSFAKDKGLNVEVLIKSSQRSGTVGSPFNINPLQQFSPANFNKSNLVLSVALRGKFKSFYTGKPVPDSTKTNMQVITESPETRIVVVGDVDFIKDSFLNNKTNVSLFLNIVDWMTQDEGLIAIRSRGVTERPLKEVSNSTKSIIKYVNILAMPLVVIIFGIVKWQVRQMKKKEII